MTNTARKQGGDRKALLAKVHIAKKHLGLDDATYRVALRQVTGYESAADCSDAELVRLVEHFKSKGFVPTKVKGDRRRASQAERTYLPKLRALWLSGWNLGVVFDPSDKAMIAFVRRQTGLDHVRFLRDASDAMKAIEGLKAWIAREGGVSWNDFPDEPRLAVVYAQWRRALELNAVSPERAAAVQAKYELAFDISAEAVRRDGKLDELMTEIGEMIRSEMVGRGASVQ